MTETADFTQSKWIWAGYPEFDLLNCHIHLRKGFDLPRVPRKAVVHVTADTRYRLYVNGQHVCRGPARGYQSHWPYDSVDIAPYLRPGRNVIAAAVYCTGIGTFQYIHQDIAGFLLAGTVGKVDLASGDSWKARRAPGNLPIHTRVICPHMGFQEYFDARLDDEGWLATDFDDSAWPAAIARAFGCMPWHSMEERGIPLLREEVIAPVKLVSRAASAGGAGFAAATNVVTLLCEEGQKWAPASAELDTAGTWASLDAAPAGPEGYVSYCIDFGKEVVGSIRLAVEGCAGGEIVDTIVTEGLDGPAPIVVHPDKAPCKLAMGNRLICRPGRTEHEQYDHWGFRYLILTVRGSQGPLRLSVQLRWIGYPLEIAAAFDSSNARLNQVWQISAWTQQCCMLDAYMDCPWREQAQWWGDARVQGKNTFYLSADARLFRRGVLQIGQMSVPNGLTYAHAPTIAHGCVLPDFTLTWVVTHHDYWYQTADLSLFRQMSQRVHEALAYFAEKTAANGLLPYDPRYWLFLDWTGLFKEGYSTVYNLFYLLALDRAAEMFGLIGERKSAAMYAARAKALRRSIVARLFDQATGSLLGGLDWKDKPVAQDSPHAYALAILTDLLGEHHERFIADQLLPFIAGDHTGPTAAGPFYSFYIFEAMKKYGRGAEVVECIDRWWGKMVDRGLSTTEENWDVTAGASSLCHAWSAHPIVHLSNILLGVWQDAPRWKKIVFRPEFTLVDFAEGKVATPLGAVSSSWRRKGDKIDVRLRLPKGMKARVELPGQKAANITGSGRWSIDAPAK